MLHPAERVAHWLHPLLATMGALLLSLAFLGSAHAEARLRAAPVASGEHITFGDLFDNAGAAASQRVARAPAAGQQVVFDAPILQTRANLAGISWRNGEGVSRVVVSGAAAVSRVPATARPSVAASQPAVLPIDGPSEIAVLTRSIARGETIDASDVMWMETPANTPRDAITDADAMIGKTARRALQPDRPIRSADLMETPVVRRGETITLLYESGGLRLTMRGRALANATAGETVRVTNLSSNRTVEAIAESEGVARVMSSGTSTTIIANAGVR
jgi:flagellar basal body P-ring formation protein FlgA